MTDGAGRGSTAAGAASVERILDTATRIFAAEGFAGTRVRDIAAGAGLNVATVQFHVGPKEDLYLLVFRRLKERENEALQNAFARTTARLADPAPDVVSIAVDLAGAYIDWFAAEPHAAALWVRRWLDDATSTGAGSREYDLDFYTLAEQVLAAAADAGTILRGDHHLALEGFIWMTCGRQIDGLLDTPERRDRYRAFAADYIRRFLAPPGPGTARAPDPDAGPPAPA